MPSQAEQVTVPLFYA